MHHNSRSDKITKVEYKHIAISREKVKERIQEIIKTDNLKINSKFNDKELSCINKGTKDLTVIKSISSKLNCTWQYIAGLSFSRWADDVFMTYFIDKKGLYQEEYFKRELEKFDYCTDEFKRFIGERLIQRRDSMNITQEDMGKYIGKSRQYYSRFESGEENLWKHKDILEIISERLDCTPEFLLLMTDNDHGHGMYNHNFLETINPISTSSALYLYYSYLKDSSLDKALSDAVKEMIETKDNALKIKAIKVLKVLLNNKSEKEEIIDIIDILISNISKSKKN